MIPPFLVVWDLQGGKYMKELKLEYDNGNPVMKMDTGEVKVVVSFAKEKPQHNPKEAIVEILTAQYTDMVSANAMCTA